MIGGVNLRFWKELFRLSKIFYPKFFSKMTLYIFVMIFAMIARTIMSIFVASLNGWGAQAIMDRNLKAFLKNMAKMAILAFPASICNSMLKFMNRRIAFEIRENLVYYFQEEYLSQMKFYQLSNLDSRIENPDQRFTEDIKKFADSIADAFMNLVKPSLDLVLFTKSLTDKLGFGVLALNFVWYGISGFIIRIISPPMGLLTTVQQNLDGEYRSQHGYIKANAQEICMLRGTSWENSQLKTRYNKLHGHSSMLLKKRLFLGTFDNILTKYGATIMGYFILSRPAMKLAAERRKKAGNSPTLSRKAGVTLQQASMITQEYMRNGSLMINLAKSIGRIVITYKDLQKIAGYTVLISELNQVMKDLKNGRFFRPQVGDGETQPIDRRPNCKLVGSGTLETTENERIVFENVPLQTPNGNVLVESLSMTLNRGQNMIITGPNGIGKSSLFRVLGGLWPLVSGRLERPTIQELFYLPQKPYLSEGTLEQQIIYPHLVRKESVTREELLQNLHFVELENLVRNGERDFDNEQDWQALLGQGEKQRMAMARMLYHKPKFAILDECTSTVSSEMEAKFYNACKDQGISLFTISHRISLFKYHDLHLRIEKDGAKVLVIDHSVDDEENFASALAH